MGRKEEVMRSYYEKAPHFAGLLNGWLFRGKEKILPGQVLPVDSRYTASSGKDRRRYYRSRCRDIVKKVENLHLRLIIGMELQTYVDYAMPVRIMDYDAVSYGRQLEELRADHKAEKDLPEKSFLSGVRRADKLVPVLTLVLYLGEKEWDAPGSLHGLLDFSEIPEGFRPYIENYSVHVLDVMHTSDERLREFPREIACMFLMLKYQKDKKKLRELLGDLKLFENVEPEVFKTVWDYTGERTALEIREKTEDENEKEETNMFQAFRELLEDSRLEGEEHAYARTDKLTLLLMEEERYDDLKRSARDREYREELFRAYGI